MSDNLGFLKDKDVVVIIGGGPAGTSCAIKLKKLSTQKGICHEKSFL